VIYVFELIIDNELVICKLVYKDAQLELFSKEKFTVEHLIKNV